MRYFFHIRNGDRLERDRDGTDFSTIEETVSDAVKAAREILAEMVLNGKVIDGQRFEVTTEDGVVLKEVPFKNAMLLE